MKLKFKKIIPTILCAVLSCAIFCSCGSGGGVYESATEYNGFGMYATENFSDSFAYDADVSKDNIESERTERKIVYTASMDIECADIAQTISQIRKDTRDAGGYVDDSSEHNYGSGSKYATLVVKIPSENYANFMATSDGYGNITDRRENRDDITNEYVDVESRVKAYRAQREKLEEMREDASDLNELLTIEDKISDIQYRLESYESRLMVMDRNVAFCTVTFDLTQPLVMTNTSTKYTTRLGKAFKNGVTTFVEFMADLSIWIAENILFILLFAVIIIVIRKQSKKKAAKKAETIKKDISNIQG